jgi:Tfp pilus assembly protein PilZ
MRKWADQAREGYITALLWEQIHWMYGDHQLPLFMRSNDWTREEKRVHPRLPCFLLVDYAVQDCVYRDFIKDISIGGAFIESHKLPTGPEIIMVLSLFGDSNPIKMAGRVVWIGEQGIGVKFERGLLHMNRSQ